MEERIAIKTATVTGIRAKVYTGKKLTQKPVITVGDTELELMKDYTLSYKNNEKVGKATVTITGKGVYTGSVKKTFKINPKGTTIAKLTKAKKAFTVKWKKQAIQTTGYQIQYSLKSNFESAKTVTVAKATTVSRKISKLKSKKKYYVRVRTYRKVGTAKYYSAWSKARTVKTKK